MFNFINLGHHLDSNERIEYFFRPSRKAYILQYLFYGVLFLAALFFSFYGKPSSNLFILWKFINYASRVILLFAAIMLLFLEYRIWSRRYALTTEHLLYSRGIFSEVFKSTQYSRVTDIKFSQTLWDKIMNTGSLIINTSGTDNYEIRYRKISAPLHVKRMINDRQ
jgi:uncharacterized membrane protein YdbT with pleckstrin-like domain